MSQVIKCHETSQSNLQVASEVARDKIQILASKFTLGQVTWY